MKYTKYFSIITLAFIASGCASQTQQFFPIPKSTHIDSNTSRIKVYRESQLRGSAYIPVIKDNGVGIGKLSDGGQLVWDRPSGTSCLTAYQDKTCFKAVGGKTTIIEFEISEGFILKSFEASNIPANIVDINQ